MWGESIAPKKILLNGTEFAVTNNLLGALHHLRRKSTFKGRLFWIDAICINQHDVEEKTQQVRIMGHIYERASSVVVWLGDKYSKYRDILSSKDLEEKIADGSTPSIEDTEESESSGGSGYSTEEAAMANSLAQDEYWTRLWIIQELGKARLLTVCFGDSEWSWQNFIHFLTMHNVGREGPLRLSRQLRQARNGSHFLSQLLTDHRQAMCKDRKDKIYGLVGLAADAIGFPIDYTRSPIEIWVDTMKFLNGRRLVSKSDYVPYGRLVKSLLMGDDTEPLEQVRRPVYQPRADEMSLIVEHGTESSNEKVFQIQGYILGYIRTLGPSVQDIVGNLKSVDHWRDIVQRYFRNKLGPANEESDALLRDILDSDDEKLASMCPGSVGNVRWRIQYPTCQALRDRLGDTIQNRRAGLASLPGSNASNGSHPHLLYQMIHLTYEDLPWRMGIVPVQAQRGDLLCWVSGIQNAILARLFESGEALLAQVLGTAVVSEDIAELSFNHEDRVTRLTQALFQCGLSYLPPLDLSFPIRVDAWTLFALLSE